MSSIDLKDLTLTFPDGTTGLDNINLAIKEHEFIALVGPSGSGKTTLLRTIAGFLTPTAGSIDIAGQDCTGVPPEKRQMGMVFQQHAVWPHMSVSDNVAYPLKMAKVPRDERKSRVQRALGLVGLEHLAARKPDALSGGQRQRVALARAIVADPTVLLLDEALSALDEPLRDSLRRELVALTRREGLTTVHVTHDRQEALSIADRVVVLNKGRIMQVATPQELISRPANAEVASFISDATIVAVDIDAHRVTAAEIGASWPRAQCELPGGKPAGQAAILPSHVTLVSESPAGAVEGDSGAGSSASLGAGFDSGSAGAHARVRARVSSALFEHDHYSLTATTDSGVTFRTTARTAPRIDDEVELALAAPLVF